VLEDLTRPVRSEVTPTVDELVDPPDEVTSKPGGEPTFFVFDEHGEFGYFGDVFEKLILDDVGGGLPVEDPPAQTTLDDEILSLTSRETFDEEVETSTPDVPPG
jgi:hypothetical protein